MSQSTTPATAQVAARPDARGRSCFGIVAAFFLVLASIGLQVWNATVHAPWSSVTVRAEAPAFAGSPYTRVNPYGVNTFLSAEVEEWKRTKTVEMVAAAGIGWIKQQFLWSEIEPSRGSHWDEKYQQDAWKKYDDIVATAERFGVRVIARLDHTPAWARPPGTDANTPPTDPEDFGRFVGEFVARYRGRVQFIQVWNEPNLAVEWGGEIDPAGYAALLRSAYTHAKRANPDVVVLSAPMAMTNERSARAMPELEYWEELYRLGAGDYFDVMTASAYGLDQPPTAPPDPETINVRRVELLRALMEAHGDGDKAVWLNEYGWDAVPPTIPDEELIWRRVSEEEQAAWTADGIRWMREAWPWLGVTSIWYFRQVGDIPPSAPVYYFRMVDTEFTPRDVYLAVQRDALAGQLALPGTYTALESPIVAVGSWGIVHDDRVGGGLYITSAVEGASIELRFAGTDVDLLLPPGVRHGTIMVEVDGKPAPVTGPLKRGSDGQTMLDLSALPPETRHVTVVAGLDSDRPQAEHHLRLTLGPDSAVALSGITVRYERSVQSFAGYGLLGVAGLAGAGLLVRRRR